MRSNDIKLLPIIEYLAYKGFKPHSKIKDEAYYLCPYRHERQPSLAVNTNKNVWFDFGENVGGSIIDLALRLFNGQWLEANADLEKFASGFVGERNARPYETGRDSSRSFNGITIINVRDICHSALSQLITSRGISIEVARKYCKEVWFENRDKRRCFAIGLPNVAMGWELRGLKSFKCSTHPKAISLMRTGESRTRISVFEGLFDMLSYADFCMVQKNAQPSCDLLCLNSLSLVNSSYAVLDSYSEIDLYLDTDNSGRKATEDLTHRYGNAKDKSTFYSAITNCKDMNEWYIRYQLNKLQ